VPGERWIASTVFTSFTTCGRHGLGRIGWGENIRVARFGQRHFPGCLLLDNPGGPALTGVFLKIMKGFAFPIYPFEVY